MPRRLRKSINTTTKKSFSLVVSSSLLLIRLFLLLSSWSSLSWLIFSFRDENYYFDVMMDSVGVGGVGSWLSSVAVVANAFVLNHNNHHNHRHHQQQRSRTTTTTMKLQASLSSDINGLSFDTIQTMARKRYHNNDIMNNTDDSTTTQQQQLLPPMNGRVVVITGAAGGIGSELTQLLYKLGATIIALDRNSIGLHELQQNSLTKNEDDKDTTTTTTTTHQEEGIMNNGKIVTMTIRQEDLSNVANIANEITSKYPRIDLLINNAGLSYSQTTTVLGSQQVKSVNGYDLLFTVNYLSHFLLTEKLLPNLNNDGGGRIVHITSTFHWKVDGSELLLCSKSKTTSSDDSSDKDVPLAYESNPSKQGPDHLGRSYANSKLAQILYSHYINRNNLTTAYHNVQSVCACPTWAATGIAGDEGRDFLSKFAFKVKDCGPGMTSIINACLRTDEELGNAVVGRQSQSFVANCHLMDYMIGKEFWLRWSIWRDSISGIVAILLLVLQQYTYSDDLIIIQKSSPESCDITKQNQFYDWSKKQISSYL